MTFGWEVDNPTGSHQLTGIEYEHFTESDLLLLAGRFVGFEVRRVRPLELQRDALAHHTNDVDRVHQRVSLGGEQVAGGFAESRHQKY